MVHDGSLGGYLERMARLEVAVVGASGYGGAELVRLLASHPCAGVGVATSGRSAGEPLRKHCPWLATDLILEAFDPETLRADVAFLCQEAGFAMRHARTLVERGIRVVDLSADFRLSDASAYPAYYKLDHADLDLLKEAVYGLPELENREEIAAARVVANPGCHATAAQMGLVPLVRAGLVEGVPVIDAKSGVSGAGRSRKETEYLFSELDNGVRAYVPTAHRHTPEIERAAGMPVRFTPHLIPMPRGLQATVYAPLSREADPAAILREFYANEPFVTVEDAPPSTKQVTGTNRVAMSAHYDARTRMSVVCVVIDNLGKGAAGQAIQNMNLMFGLPEDAGLGASGLWP